MAKPWVRFKSIEENRDGYCVSYNPVSTENNLAVLVVSFYEEVSESDAVRIMENELKQWIEKYPTALMVMPSTELGKFKLDLEKHKGNGFVLGYLKAGELVFRWESMPNDEYEHINFSQDQLIRMYEGLSFRTSDEAEGEIRQRVLQNKTLIALMVFWFCVVPGAIAYLGFASPYISLCVLVYSLYKAFLKALELTGKLKPMAHQLERTEKERIMAHHHYHCALNPEGFEKLKLENFRRERNEKNEAKVKKLRAANKPV